MQDATTSAYTATLTELEASMTNKPPKDTSTKEPKADEAEVQLKKLKPGPNNPEEAKQFKEDLKKVVDLFENRIHSFDRYEVE